MSSQVVDLLAFYPNYQFEIGDDFLYDAAEDIIYYQVNSLNTNDGQIALLHEIAHAQLGHFHYASDFELFAMETQAWNRTRQLARQHNLPLSEDYVTDCLASYATWLHKRATCPTCSNFSLQMDELTYRCFLCDDRWQVKVDSLALSLIHI